MDRRKLLSVSTVGAASALALPMSARAQSQLPTLRWRMASAYPRSLDTIFGAGEHVAKRVTEATGGRFNIRIFPANEIVPGAQVLDAVQNETVECGHSVSNWYIGKESALLFGTSVPFGMNTRQHNAWMYYGGGRQLMAEVYGEFGIHAIPAGDTGAQMGGWFRREIKTVADLKGLKFRISGLAGKALAKLGVVPQQLAPSDIYPALEKGTLDAAEWVGPYDDEKLAFNKIAKYYYYPGWWEGGAQISLMVNQKKWASLPDEYKAIFEAACAEANILMTAKYDTLNPPAMKRLLASGTQARPFPKPVMDACAKVMAEVMNEQAEANPRFKKVYVSWKKFRDEQADWFRYAEASFDQFNTESVKGRDSDTKK